MASPLTRLSLLAGVLLSLPSLALQASVYRCQTPDGVVFADQPCGQDAETVTIRDNRIGGNFGDNLPEFPAPEGSDGDPEETLRSSQPESPCRHINSTKLRTYLARNQVVQGMTREQVQRAFGQTSEVHPMPQETWVYQTRYYGALYELTYVYFRDGCVEREEYRKP